MNQLKEKYLKKIAPEMAKKFKYKNLLQVPKLVKIVLSRGVNEGTTDPKATDAAALELSEICGQHAMITKAKKAIAAFKLRARDPIGCVATLRGERMYHFFNKLVNISLPKVRDFRGLSKKSFDGRGNYSFGIKEQLIFPEVDYDKVNKVRGMNITICTTAKNDEEALELLKLFNVPFREK